VTVLCLSEFVGYKLMLDDNDGDDDDGGDVYLIISQPEVSQNLFSIY
jgi:hypothetical protein